MVSLKRGLFKRMGNDVSSSSRANVYCHKVHQSDRNLIADLHPLMEEVPFPKSNVIERNTDRGEHAQKTELKPGKCFS